MKRQVLIALLVLGGAAVVAALVLPSWAVPAVQPTYSPPPGAAASHLSTAPANWAPMERLRYASPLLTVTVSALPGRATTSALDAWPSLSKDPTLKAMLGRELPLFLDDGARDGGDHTVVVYAIYGATETSNGADIYAQAMVARWIIRDGLLRSAWDLPSGDILIRTAHAGADWTIREILTQGDGDALPPPDVFPEWADIPEGMWGFDRLAHECTRLGLDWASHEMQRDRLVAQPARQFTDPHAHTPPIDAVRMLAARYHPMTIRALGKMRDSRIDDRWDVSWASEDGRFHLYYGVDIKGMLLVDRRKKLAYDVSAPGQVPPDIDGVPAGGMPVFVGHTLVIDQTSGEFENWSGDVHYEVDCDQLKVVRAVPIGPLALN